MSRRPVIPALLQLTTAVLLSGCAQGPPTAPAQTYGGTSQTVIDPATHFYGNDWMYSGQPSGNEAVVYKRKSSGFSLAPYETLTSGFSAPMGMVTTPGGLWYIANSGDSNVLVYRTTRRGPTGPTATLSDPEQVPVNVAVTPSRQLVAVSNGSTTGGGPGSVSVYLNAQTKPSRTLTYGSNPIYGEGVAIDSNGNCYWSFNDRTAFTGSIVKFAGCNGSGTLLRSGILKAGGMAFDKSGDFYYVDQLAGIYRCKRPSSSCSLFTPIGGAGGLVTPANINFDNHSPQNLWVADAAGYIDAVSLSGLIVYTVEAIGGATDPPIGIAPAPGS